MKQITPFEKKQLTDCGYDEKQIVMLSRYASLISQWQKAINLVSGSTLPDIWSRHIVDSAQLWPIMMQIAGSKTGFSAVDLGSGAGLPGIILAIAGIKQIDLIESDTRKSVFLKEVVRELGLKNCTIKHMRIENASNLQADFVTARALAPLPQLIEWGSPFLKDGGHFVLLKGAEVTNEIADIDKNRQLKIFLHHSLTAEQAKIVVLPHIVPREA